MAEPGQWPGPQWITVSSMPSKIGWSRLILGITIRPIDVAGTIGWTSPPRLTLWALAGSAVGATGAGRVVVVVGGRVVDVVVEVGATSMLGTSKACSVPAAADGADRTTARVPPAVRRMAVRTPSTSIWSP